MSISVGSLSFIGRILLAGMFLMSGINKIFDPSGTQQYMAAMGMTWLTGLFYIGAILLEVGGALSVLVGYRARIGAWLLVAFTIPATLVFHTNFADANQMIHFLKNLSIMGGLLYIAAYGAGAVSLDARLEGGQRGPASSKPPIRRAVNQ